VARIDVIMPQMGESIAEGTLSRWLKKVGDAVKRDEPMFEISTDKVDAEIPAPNAGVIAEILVVEGQTVAVQTVVARIETEAGAAVSATVGAGAPAASATAAVSAARPAAPSVGGPPRKESIPSLAPLQHQFNAGRIPSPTGASGSPGTPTFEERVRARSSPLVRKMAADQGIDVAALRGTGVAGRVTKRDLVAAIENGSAAAAHRVAPSMHAPGGGEPHGPMAEPWPGDIVEPMSVMRQRIAEHMVVSRRTSAHVTSFMEIDLTRIARIRAANRAAFEAATGLKLTSLPFIIRAVVDGLKAFPVVNASIAGQNVIYRKQYNIGVAVALDWGLIVPVIKRAEDLSLSGITRVLNDLAARARAKKLAPAEVQDGTFTITNPGVFGSLMGTPIISQPQVAILGIGAIEKRPKVLPGSDGEDTIAIRTCSYFSISFDHRLIDGAVADQFLAHVKRSLETFPDNVL
jgi:2-oxoglutarate dehydrogenase E2 component (dihydrolipoamide succinyltransferase)